MEKHVVTGALTSMFWRHLGARRILYLHDIWLTASSEETIKLHLSLTSSQRKCWAYQINKKKSIMFPQTSLSVSGWWAEESESGFLLSSQKNLRKCQKQSSAIFPNNAVETNSIPFSFLASILFIGTFVWGFTLVSEENKEKKECKWNSISGFIFIWVLL